MVAYKYSTELKENMAKAVGLALPISSKVSREVCAKIRGMKLDKAKTLLEDVIALKAAIPYRRYTGDVPHQAGVGPGRYPVKASMHILKILKAAEANAQFKGLSINNLFIKHVSAQKGSKTIRYGRRHNIAKRTNIEVVLEEKK
ncbi:MAG TPA: 50S ribosomal protein L22 [Candidatus Woesearchaeota archaeon]|nr:MAG: 50S ribosomal protein L22 [Candidatus Woesearchaeota archaeon]HDD70638.1 50S ribosomal protein L22 [Candidatus Woesearchaeota archaeon]